MCIINMLFLNTLLRARLTLFYCFWLLAMKFICAYKVCPRSNINFWKKDFLQIKVKATKLFKVFSFPSKHCCQCFSQLWTHWRDFLQAALRRIWRLPKFLNNGLGVPFWSLEVLWNQIRALQRLRHCCHTLFCYAFRDSEIGVLRCVVMMKTPSVTDRCLDTFSSALEPFQASQVKMIVY